MKRLLPLLLLGACSPGPAEVCAVPAFDAQAHRGGRSHRPENTLPAFEYAVSHGIRTLEMDLAVTRDDVLVLSHDPVLLKDRCLTPEGAPAEDVPIRTLTLAELKRFDCGTLPNADFPDQQAVPHTPPATLEEVVTMAELRTGGAIRYNMEPKMDPAFPSSWTPDAEAFMDLLERDLTHLGIRERTTVESFDARPLRVLMKRNSTLHRAFLWPSDKLSLHAELTAGNPVDLARSFGCEVLSSYAPLTRKPLIDLAHAAGMRVIPWTVNSRSEMERLMGAGVDGIISDNVDLLVQVETEEKPQGGVCF